MRIRISWLFLLLLTFFYLISTSAWELRCNPVAEGLFVLGLVLTGIGAMGRVWCSAYIAGRKNETLIIEGPYSICRNPLYFFSLIGSVGAGLATETVTIPIVVLIAFALYYPAVIKSEETRMMGLHGAEFQSYVQKTPCFFPNWQLLHEREDGLVNLVIFRKHILSAVWFVWLPAGMEFVELLHETNVLPNYFFLY